MKTAKLIKGGEVLIPQVMICLGLLERMRGLIGSQGLGKDKALFLPCCNSIHTFLMKFPLDLIFIDRMMSVVKIRKSVVPNRIIMGGIGAYGVLEMESGWFPYNRIETGDRISLDFQC